MRTYVFQEPRLLLLAHFTHLNEGHSSIRCVKLIYVNKYDLLIYSSLLPNVSQCLTSNQLRLLHLRDFFLSIDLKGRASMMSMSFAAYCVMLLRNSRLQNVQNDQSESCFHRSSVINLYIYFRLRLSLRGESSLEDQHLTS